MITNTVRMNRASDVSVQRTNHGSCRARRGGEMLRSGCSDSRTVIVRGSCLLVYVSRSFHPSAKRKPKFLHVSDLRLHRSNKLITTSIPNDTTRSTIAMAVASAYLNSSKRATINTGAISVLNGKLPDTNTTE